MENYICIGGRKFELSGEELERAREAWLPPDGPLAEVPVGETFFVGEYEFVVLEHCCGETAVILRGMLEEDEVFDKENNRYDGSNADKICMDFGVKLAALVGVDNLVPHVVDLTSDDGLKDYGSVERKASLLTAEQYRKYVDILDQHKVEDYWWLATPFSTARHGNTSWVKCVAPVGYFSNSICNDDYGVRPFCIFKSNIFVSR